MDLADAIDVPVQAVTHPTTLDDLRVDRNGQSEVSDENLPMGLSWWTRLRNERILGKLARLARGIDFEHPWRSTNAHLLDGQTVRSWLREHTSDHELRTFVEEQLTIEAGFSADRISLLWLLAHIGPAPAEYAPPLRLDANLLVSRLASQVQDVLRPGRHVSQIIHDENGVYAAGDWGRVAADRAILALSPADAARIEFNPALPPSRCRLQQQWPQAEIIRTEIIYWRPFWRHRGMSGTIHFCDGVPAWTMDDSPADSSYGRLIAHTYTFGDADPLGADQDITDNSVRHRGLLLDNLGNALGPLATDPIAVTQSPLGPGAYTSAYQAPMPPGFLTEHGVGLRNPVGPIHWAASETAGFPDAGTLNGALLSAYRAAREIHDQS